MTTAPLTLSAGRRVGGAEMAGGETVDYLEGAETLA